MNVIGKKNILGVNISNASRKDILEYIIKSIENFKKKVFVVTPNPEFLVLANKNKEFKDVLNKADLASIDGVGIVIAAKILGKPLRERFTGVDLVKSLCSEVSEKPITVGFLGGKGGVAEIAAECLQKMCPGLRVAFAGEEWSDEGFVAWQPLISDDDRTQNPEKGLSRQNSIPKDTFHKELHISNLTMKQLNNKTIDILFVAFGAPKQEFWIDKNLKNLPVKVAIGVGGAFDYISGKVPRAPVFVRNIGMEWLFRLVIQPWRIKRQLALLKFVWLVAKEKIRPS
jgi:N-acetylglucosaminyldiphosphoundecaprenol N-acetyl-beta-D-mannosaminyltransferase